MLGHHMSHDARYFSMLSEVDCLDFLGLGIIASRLGFSFDEISLISAGIIYIFDAKYALVSHRRFRFDVADASHIFTKFLSLIGLQ